MGESYLLEVIRHADLASPTATAASRALAISSTSSGCTVHVCDNEYDHGPVVLQREVPVLPDDTVESLAARVFEAECETYPEAIKRWIAERRG